MPSTMGFEVEDFGPISFPIIQTEAKRLIKKCKPIIFKSNEITRVGKSIRASYNLDPNSVEIKNPEWNAKLKELVTRVAKTLGCQNDIEVNLFTNI